MQELEYKEIRITYFSQPSERCPRLAVLHTITRGFFFLKIESKTQQKQPGCTPSLALIVYQGEQGMIEQCEQCSKQLVSNWGL